MEDQKISLVCYKMLHENLQDYDVQLVKPKTTTLSGFVTFRKLVLPNVVTRNASTIAIDINVRNLSINIKDILSSIIACNQCVQVWNMLKDMMFNFHAQLVCSRYIMLRTCRIFFAPVYSNSLSWRRQNNLLLYSKRHQNPCHDQKCHSSGNSIHPQKSSNLKDTPKRKRAKAEKRSISRQDLEPFFSGSMMEAATYLGVSRSTIKRKCRKLGISQWPSCKGNKRCKNVPAFANNDPESANLRFISSEHDISNKRKHNQSSMSKHPALELMSYKYQTKTDPNLSYPRKTTSVPVYDESGRLAEPFTKKCRLSDSISSELKVVGEEREVVTIKATYKEDMTRFNFPIKSSIMDLKNEVGVRLKLKAGRFKLKYWDDEDEWALLGWDSDWEDCVWISRSSQCSNNVIRVLVQDL